MIQLGRLPVGHRLIGGKGIAHLLDLLGQPQHPFAIEHGGDLLQRQGVVLDGQRCLYGADAIAAPQLGRQLTVARQGQVADQLADFTALYPSIKQGCLDFF